MRSKTTECCANRANAVRESHVEITFKYSDTHGGEGVRYMLGVELFGDDPKCDLLSIIRGLGCGQRAIF